jgi:hypothetical protein
MHVTCSVHHIVLDLVIIITFGEEYKLRISLLCISLQYRYFINLRSKYSPQHRVFSNTHSLCFSFSVRDWVSHPYKTTYKIIFLYILIFIFLCNRRVDERFYPVVVNINRIQSTLNFFMSQILIYYCFKIKYFELNVQFPLPDSHDIGVNSFHRFVLSWTAHSVKLAIQDASGNRRNEVDIATDYGLDDRGIGFRVPVESRMFISAYYVDRFWGPPSLLAIG